LADLTKLRYHIRKELHPVRIIDGFELICSNNYTREKVEHAISTGWSSDTVHPSKHVYAKTALHLLEKIAPALDKAATTVNPGSLPPGRKQADLERQQQERRGSRWRLTAIRQRVRKRERLRRWGLRWWWRLPNSQKSNLERTEGHGGGGGQRHFEHQPRTSDGGGYYGEHEHGRDRQSRERFSHWEDHSGGGGGSGYGGGYASGYGGGAGGRGGRGRRN
jgi:hypothetical protein